jgi:hypothetical protein
MKKKKRGNSLILTSVDLRRQFWIIFAVGNNILSYVVTGAPKNSVLEPKWLLIYTKDPTYDIIYLNQRQKEKKERRRKA